VQGPVPLAQPQVAFGRPAAPAAERQELPEQRRPELPGAAASQDAAQSVAAAELTRFQR